MAKSIVCGMRGLGWMKSALSYIHMLGSASNTLHFWRKNKLTEERERLLIKQKKYYTQVVISVRVLIYYTTKY